jgi:hypothetical protein
LDASGIIVKLVTASKLLQLPDINLIYPGGEAAL